MENAGIIETLEKILLENEAMSPEERRAILSL